MEGLKGVDCIADDILLSADNDAQHDTHVCNLLKRYEHHDMTFKLPKSQFKVPEVMFQSHIFSAEGLKADPEKIDAIAHMPAPNDVEGVLCFWATAAYLAKFVPMLSSVMEPISKLTYKEVE